MKLKLHRHEIGSALRCIFAFVYMSENQLDIKRTFLGQPSSSLLYYFSFPQLKKQSEKRTEREEEDKRRIRTGGRKEIGEK